MKGRFWNFFRKFDEFTTTLIQSHAAQSKVRELAESLGAGFRFDPERARVTAGRRVEIPVSFFRKMDEVGEVRVVVRGSFSKEFHELERVTFHVFRDPKAIALFDEFFSAEPEGFGEKFFTEVA